MDEATQSILFHLDALGVECVLAPGDVTVVDDVRQVFKSASRPIAGIIHGPMVLRV